MIHYIKGKLAMKFEGGVVLETGCIGYEINVPENDAVYLATSGQEAFVYTAMTVREDDVSLYGFSSQDSLALFRRLVTVSGVGAKAAMALLSAMSADALKKAIVFEDAAALTKANGVGKKIAQRIVLELKDKLGAVGGLSEAAEGIAASSAKTEAISGLIALGYSRGEAVEALSGITEADLTTEQYMKQALKRLF